jgi:tripeptide aminopeptidase
MKQALLDRLTTYVKVDTQADMTNQNCPSSPGQFTLANMLVEELKSIGMSDITIDHNGYVMATLPSNTEKEVPVIGFLAHVDTAPDFTGMNVKPQLVNSYDGGDIVLNEVLNIVLSPEEFPNLENYVGHSLVTTDGTTLLGADNKAGIAEIMTAMEFLINNPQIKHGHIRIAFTPDEEIGRGPHKFDVKKFDATYAYTVDGGPVGELQFESFNAASAFITFNGNNVHPGTAKDVMVHSGKIAMEFHSKLPCDQAPEKTSGYEGFFHLIHMKSEVEKTDVFYIIRDFDQELFDQKKAFVHQIVGELQEKYGEDAVELKMEDSYYNMAEKIKPVKEVIEVAEQAMKNLGITPVSNPIRGGTDGSQLSYMGLPTPNIFTGGENFHGKFEFVSLDVMEKATMTIVEIVKLFEAQA